jgi:hypothetical protein
MGAGLLAPRRNSLGRPLSNVIGMQEKAGKEVTRRIRTGSWIVNRF